MKYSSFVIAFKKPAKQLKEEFTPSDCDLIQMTMGISGEAGELLDAIKKAVIYRKHIDINNVIEELGDLEFYLEGLRQTLGITREEVIAANMLKLSKRYEKGTYANEAAINRKDKNPIVAASKTEQEHFSIHDPKKCGCDACIAWRDEMYK